MRKSWSVIAILMMLSCGQVQLVRSESVQAQTTQDRKAEADRLRGAFKVQCDG